MGPREGQPHGGVDLYVGGAEHAVLHLLYARFWSKVLFDLGHVSSAEPFHKLFNQGMIQAYVYRDSRGIAVPAAEVEERDGAYYYQGEKVSRLLGKMGKSLKNAVTPDEICAEYGADTLRLYEMAMGPLDVSRPWDTRAVVGQFRLLQRLWRNVVDEATGEVTVVDTEPDEDTPARPAQGHRRRAPGPGGPAVQHRHRQGHRAEQPPDQGGRPGVALGRRGPGAAGRAAGPAHRRGAVAQAGPRGLGRPPGLPGRRPGVRRATRP